MPATATHTFFAEDVYSKLKTSDKKLDDSSYKKYKMFAQSTDPLMFYNVESILPGKNVRDFQNYFHSHHSQTFFISLCYVIKNDKLIHNAEVLSFLYGFITHYVLDSNVHPYVYYKTGYFDKKKKETYKYNNLHNFMELYIDNIMIEKRTNTNPYSFKIHEYSFDISPFSKELNMTINKAFAETFNVNNMDKIYYKSILQMKRFFKRYRYDRFGIKKVIYKTIDLFLPKKAFVFKVLSYHNSSNDIEYYLNNKHNTWYNPIDINISSNDSFFDLYDKSINEACEIISLVNSFFNDENINLEDIFINKSYITGLNCNINNSFKKFEI